MSEENNQPTDVQSTIPQEVIAKVADFQQELFSLCTHSELPFPIVVEQLITTAAVAVVHQKLSRAQFMELCRIVFTKVQALNKQGLVQDKDSPVSPAPPAGPSIIMPGK